ncbi:MAG: ribonuclease H-like domain-containing protein [Fibrobacteria bacterium]|nr:ribonuclease H-like domain-containing protein [Fibrobacteria bacterium]
MVHALESKAPWGLRRAVEKDRKSDENDRPPYARADRETFVLFELAEDRPMRLEEIVEGHEVQTPFGPLWLLDRPLEEFWSPMPTLPPIDPSRMWFDIETQGGRGQPGFLFGAVFHDGSEWRLWQALARDHSEEKAWLHLVTEMVQQRPNLVSYSGSKNDWPFLLSRWKVHHLKPPVLESHLDLFDRAQEHYRGVLPSCRLVTLERHLCGRWRESDLPSGYIPQAYVDWLAHRDGRLLAQVMLHNALDVVCLLELEPLLCVDACPMPPRVVLAPTAPQESPG